MIDEKDEKTGQQTNHQSKCKKISNYIFSYDHKLGSGSFSQVFRGIDSRNNQEVAVKIISKQSMTSQIALTLLQQEINILTELDHKNVIRCFEVIYSSNHCYIITQFCKFGDLQKILKIKGKFTEDELTPYVYHIFQGLKYLATKSIIHRDFKVANIFIGDNGACKIADFGFAKKSDSIFKDICLGSPIYMSPEAIYQKKYGPKTDIWAFGVLIYELLTGRAPLCGVKSQQELVEKIVLPPPFIKQTITNQLRSFIDSCLAYKEEQRISISEIQNHLYIKKVVNLFEGSKLTESMNSSMSDSNTKNTPKSSRLIIQALGNPISYQQGVSLLQYCRLASKVCQCVKSQILQQWVLKLIHDLYKSKLKQNQNIDYNKYKETVNSYYVRYFKQFKDRGLKVRIDDVIKQCEELLCREKKYKAQITAVGSQTTLLKQSLSHPLQLLYFSKISHAGKYMS